MSRAAAAARVVGVDLGGSKILAALAGVEAGSAIENRMRRPTRADDPVALADQLAALCRELAGDGPIAAVGIGTVGVPDEASGRILEAPNLAGVGDVDFRRLLEDRLDCPIALENDVNAAALGELDARGCGDESLVVVALGTGVGAGIVLDGRLWRGVTGRAGEIAFLPFGSDPRDPRNLVHGPFEEAVAGRTLRERYAAAGGERADRDVFAARDPVADALLDAVAGELARGVLAVEAVLETGLVVLAGGLGVREELVARTRAALAELGAAGLRLEPSRAGEDAALRGALRLARAVVGTAAG